MRFGSDGKWRKDDIGLMLSSFRTPLARNLDSHGRARRLLRATAQRISLLPLPLRELHTAPQSRPAFAPEFCSIVVRQKNRGRRECRVLDAPAASRAR